MPTRDDDGVNMSEKAEIVGREGLGQNVAQVAQQISSLEKSTKDGLTALSKEMQLGFDKIAIELRRIEDGEAQRQLHHDDVHRLESKALAESKKVEDLWRENSNGWRQESIQRMLTYPSKTEIDERVKRLEDLIARNSNDLVAAVSGPNGIGVRLKTLEDYVTTAQAQMGTLKALMAAVLFAVAIAGFVIGVRQ